LTLTTERLRLRPLTRDDLDSLAALYADPQAMRFSLGLLDRKQTREKLDKILATAVVKDWNSFAVERLEDDRFTGICGFTPQTVDEVDEVEMGYRFMPEFWGRGFATEAALACRDYAFETSAASAHHLDHRARQHRLDPGHRENRSTLREGNAKMGPASPDLLGDGRPSFRNAHLIE